MVRISMSAISTLILVQLDGELPPELNLPQLRTLAASCKSVSATLSRFLQRNASVIHITSREAFSSLAPTSGIVAIYIVGHAWMEGQQYRTSIRTREGSQVLSSGELADYLLVSAVYESSWSIPVMLQASSRKLRLFGLVPALA
jgi:hypothetical protein